MKMKNIGPCKVVKKFGANTYEIELTDGIEISPIFNVVDLYPYRDEESEAEDEQEEIQWIKQMPVVENPQMESIIDKRISKRPREKSILNTWSNGRDIQLKMLVGKMKQKFISMDRLCRSS